MELGSDEQIQQTDQLPWRLSSTGRQSLGPLRAFPKHRLDVALDSLNAESGSDSHCRADFLEFIDRKSLVEHLRIGARTIDGVAPRSRYAARANVSWVLLRIDS